MKLLILTQKVDENDSVLGFFHRWVEEFAKQYEEVIVVALGVGTYSLPSNVRVFSLGKEKGVSRIKYIFNFYKIILSERKNYDAVFVHMNPEYIVLGGVIWRIFNKKVALWYTHKSVTIKLRIASFLTQYIFTASAESFRLKSKKVHVMGHGIDTDFFTPNVQISRDKRVLSVGRLTKSKRHDLVIHAAARAGRELYIIGEGPEYDSLRMLVQSLNADVHFLGGITQTQVRDQYRKAGYLIHTSETGSLDKVVLEALACGLTVITTSTFLTGIPIEVVSATPGAIAKAMLAAQHMNTTSVVSCVKEHHSLHRLIPKIVRLIS